MIHEVLVNCVIIIIICLLISLYKNNVIFLNTSIRDENNVTIIIALRNDFLCILYFILLLSLYTLAQVQSHTVNIFVGR